MDAADRHAEGAKAWLGLVGWIVTCVAVGALAGLITQDAVTTWYPGIEKPGFTPPGWVFGPVWTVLYIMMAVAAWRLWSRHGFEGARFELSLFGAQLALNGAWSLIFFGLQAPGWALAEIIVLELILAATVRAFLERDRWAGLLLVPYLAWVSFAAVLNASIWWLNMG